MLSWQRRMNLRCGAFVVNSVSLEIVGRAQFWALGCARAVKKLDMQVILWRRGALEERVDSVVDLRVP
jgi:hypothetical protein